nr:hypothetical protein [Nostoc sp. JL33]
MADCLGQQKRRRWQADEYDRQARSATKLHQESNLQLHLLKMGNLDVDLQGLAAQPLLITY